MALKLFYHPLSSYCHKVLIALYESGIRFEGRIIDLGNEADRAELSAHWPLCKFPVLHDSKNNHSIPESSAIIEYIDRHYRGAQALIPVDGDAAIDVRLWDRIFDNYVHTPMQQMVADKIRGANADLSAQRALIEAAYRLINDRMSGREWVAHAEFSLADCAATPALFYAHILHPFPPELVSLDAYFERLLLRPSVRRTLVEAQPYFHLFPLEEAIPGRFRMGSDAV